MRRRRKLSDKVVYTSLGGLIFFQLMILGGTAFYVYTLFKDVTFQWSGLIFVALLVMVQIVTISLWNERRQALNLLADWKASGLEVRRYDPARRHYYKV